MKKPTLRLLGLDPGTNSFGYCLLDVFITGKAPALKATTKIVQHGMILPTLRTLTTPKKTQTEREAFLVEFNRLLSQGVTHIIAERYMLRRGSGGTTIEAVNQMLGIIQMAGVPTRMIPASQWKNKVSSHDPDHLECAYISVKAAANITPHATDACHIAHYGVWSLCKLEDSDIVLVEPQSIVEAPSIMLGETTKEKKVRKKKRTAKAKRPVNRKT